MDYLGIMLVTMNGTTGATLSTTTTHALTILTSQVFMTLKLEIELDSYYYPMENFIYFKTETILPKLLQDFLYTSHCLEQLMCVTDVARSNLRY